MSNKTFNKMYDLDVDKVGTIMMERGLTNMSELSGKIGAGNSYVSEYVLGKGKISFRYLLPLCNALGVKKEDILLNANESDTKLPFDIPEEIEGHAQSKEDAFNEMIIAINCAINDFTENWIA